LQDPIAILAKLQLVLRRQPVLVPLLGQHTMFPLLDLPALYQIIAAAPVKCDFGTQTPTHFLEKHIDLNYEWNQWALRRRAIHLANLRNKATHSAQTLLSHFRRDNSMQVGDAACVTDVCGTEGATHGSTPNTTYMAGPYTAWSTLQSCYLMYSVTRTTLAPQTDAVLFWLVCCGC
jgi:hypothetical protein